MIPAPPGKAYLPYQAKCIRYAMGARGTIIADDMGLGKTVEAIGVINATSNGRNDLTVLIVCPSFLRLNWHRELAAWMVDSCKVDVISYHEAGRLAELVRAAPPRCVDILIVDEAHYCKNPKAGRSKDIELIAQHAKRVLLLTGTPMENAPIELWQLLKIACPERWNPNPRIEASYIIAPDKRASHPGEGQSFWEYAERYCGLRKVSFRGGSAWDFGGASNLDELATRLRATCMVRRLKSDVLGDLPDKRRQLIVLQSKADDSDLYPELNDENYFHTLANLKADRPAFSEWSKRRKLQGMQKVDDVVSIVDDALDTSAKVILFAHHTEVVERLYQRLNPNHYSVFMHGGTPMKDRQAAVDAFQSDASCRLIIGSIGAMGVGWTLTASDHVIFAELDPVPGRLTQAEDRAHRIGQRTSVLVQHLIADGSLCARMAQIAVRKQAVLSRVLDAAGATLTFSESSENDVDPFP
jgi:SWI/SNF-related matrix-associated actin-dependent regulator 1 of chromatin subfamily A